MRGPLSIGELCDVIGTKLPRALAYTKQPPAPAPTLKPAAPSSRNWCPRRKLDRPEIELVKTLHHNGNSREALAEKFGVSYEAVKRICKTMNNVYCISSTKNKKADGGGGLTMDLSVLKGKDPAGYQAEQASRKTQSETWERSLERQGRQQNPGSISAADSGQFHIYRKNRRHELERVARLENEAKEAEEDEEHFRHLEGLKRGFEDKTDRKKTKRLRRKQKGAAKQSVERGSRPGEEGERTNGNAHIDDSAQTHPTA